MGSNFGLTTEKLGKTIVPLIGISLTLISILLLVVIESIHSENFERADTWLSIVHVGALSAILFIISFLSSTTMSITGKKDSIILALLFYGGFFLGVMILFYISVKIFLETRALAF